MEIEDCRVSVQLWHRKCWTRVHACILVSYRHMYIAEVSSNIAHK